MLIDSNQEVLAERSFSKLLAVLVAVALSAILLSGYFYLRSRHAQRNAPAVPAQAATNLPKGPAKLHVLIDDPMLKGGETTIGGTVRNISSESLAGLSVELELRRRKDGNIETKQISVEPSTLSAEQEGRYEIKLAAQDYSGVRLVGLKSSDASLLAYTSGPGQRRPLERTEAKTIVVQKPASRGGEEFINTPDNPGRVP